MNKKAIAILGGLFLLIVITLGVIIYLRSGSNTEDTVQTEDQTQTQDTNPPPPILDTTTTTDTQNQNDNTNTTSTPIQTVSSTGAIQLTGDQVISPVLFFQGNGISYLNRQGQLYLNDIDNTGGKLSLINKKEVTIALKPGISKILWPQRGNNFIAEFNNGAKRSWSFYDAGKNQYTDLPPQITSINWMPSSDKIIYIWLGSDGKSTLNIANPDNTNYQTIADIYENDDEISISPDGRTILFYRRDNNDITNTINLTTPDGQIFRSLIKQGYNYGVLWSPNSRKFLFGRRDPSTQDYELFVSDVITNETQSLGVKTSPDKAVWDPDSQTVFVAVPVKGAGSGANRLTEDTLFKINTVTLEKKEFNPNSAIDASDLFLNSLGDKLFFKNEQDGGLYYQDVSSLYNTSGQ